MGRGISCRLPLLSVGLERAFVIDSWCDQEIPDWLTQIIFLGVMCCRMEPETTFVNKCHQDK